jgi:hypothetical protein
VAQIGHGKSKELYFFYGKESENHQLGTGVLKSTEQYQQIGGEFVCDRLTYIVPRHLWCNVTI